jgi:four helix bundle protein
LSVHGERFDKTKFKKRIYTLVLSIIKLIDKLAKDNVGYRVGDQLLRSSTSVIANYVEGQSSISKKEFINYLQISLKSGNESKLWLSLLKDSGRVSEQDVNELIKEMDEVCKILSQSLMTLKKSSSK